MTPSVCYEDYNPEIGRRRSNSGTSIWILLGIVIGAILLNITIILCYRRYTKREIKEEMRLQISSIMSNYFLISDPKNTQLTTISTEHIS